ncbi:MAG: hypothetical protein ISS58_01295 [Dehalococcoidales bacterium]|nr:hypothetical protein [Dehalococcoidales bacterium]
MRRAVAIPLALVFVILALLVLVAFRVNATAGNPDFYAEQLQQADVYHFIYNDVLPAALEEVEVGEDTEGAGVIISSLKPHLNDVARQTLPPEWLQANVEQVIDEVVPYVWGEKANFRITIPLKDRVEAGGEAIKSVLHRPDVFPVMYEQLIQLIIEEIALDEGGMPAMLAISEEEMEVMLRKVVPEDWLLEQIDSAVDEAVPYLTREQDHFTLEIDITRPLDELEEVLADSLSRRETYDSLFAEMLAPAIQQNLEEITQLPIGVELTDDEVVAAAKAVMPLEWYQTLVKDMVSQIFGYLRGEQDELELVIPLADRKPEIAAALGQLADEKIASAFDSLPVCTGAQLIELLLDPSLEDILCRPVDISYQEFSELVGIDAGSLVQPLIEVGIPDEWILTEADMSQLFGGEGEDNVLIQVRELVQEGLIFTEKDLNEFMATDSVSPEDIRQSIADGLTFTEQDLKSLMGDTGDTSAGEQMEAFEQVRSGLGMAKKWLNFVWLIPFLMLLAVGALGGRQWSSKLIWAAALLAVMAIIAYIIFGPVFSATAQPMIDQSLTTGFGQTEGIMSLVAQKGVAMGQNAIDSFISGLRNQAIAIIIASVVLIGVGVVLHNWDKIRRT